jgi:AAA15 family ATPase/GTPase
MIPAPKQKGLDYSLLAEEIGKKTHKALCSAVIYGANASGKTNIVGAIEVFKSIILKGNIRNESRTQTANFSEQLLELIPNAGLQKKEPVKLSITFIDNGLLVTFFLVLDLGKFLDRKYNRSVLNEELHINEQLIYKREGNNLQINNIRIIEDYLLEGFSKNKTTISIAEKSLNPEELFLMNGFKTIISAKIPANIVFYLENKLDTIYQSNTLILEPVLEEEYFKDELLNAAVKLFGINSNKLAYIKAKDDTRPTLCSSINNWLIPSELFESYGTIRFVNLFPALARVLQHGGTLIIDEFDASMHPMAIMNLITIFHNNEINSNKAQLIFNTHNPMYLNNNLFRRDEIKFVERDDDTHVSTHYSLSDFGTSGTKARKGSDYMKNYFVSEYGAIRDIDFSRVFRKIVSDTNSYKYN